MGYLSSLYSKTAPLRQRLVNALVSGIHINTDVSFGEHSITLNNDKIYFSAEATPSTDGELAYNATSHKFQWHDGTSVRVVPRQDTVLPLSGGTLSGELAMGSNKITGLANGASASQDAASVAQMESYVGNLIAQKVVVGSAGEGLIGSASESECNALSPVIGNVIVAEAAYTPSAGTSSALIAGDIAEFNGTSWVKILGSSGGFPPVGTRVLVSTASAFISGGGLTDATDEGKIAYFDGTSLVPASFTSPNDGVVIAVKGEGAVAENSVLAFDGAVPTGAWRATAAAGVAHSSLTGLTSGDDHTQYAKIAGRNGGQSITGGTGAGDDLTLISTSNGTKGDVILGGSSDTVKTGCNIVLTADTTILPATDNNVTLGNGTYRLKSIRAVEVVSGDILMRNGPYSYRLVEAAHGITMIDEADGNRAYHMIRVPADMGLLRRAAWRILGAC